MANEIHYKYIKRCIELACNGVQSNKGGPFGALVVKDGKIIAEACNQVTSSKDVTAHAEIMAIRKACDALDSHDLTGCTLYTSCWPCPMCAGAVLWSHISHVYYAASPEDALSAGFNDKPFWDHVRSAKTVTDISGYTLLSVDNRMLPFTTWHNHDQKIPY